MINYVFGYIITIISYVFHMADQAFLSILPYITLVFTGIVDLFSAPVISTLYTIYILCVVTYHLYSYVVCSWRLC